MKYFGGKNERLTPPGTKDDLIHLKVKAVVYLWYTIWIGHHGNNVIKGKKGVTFDLCVHIPSLSAQRQELYQIDVVHQRGRLLLTVTLRSHEINQRLHGGLVVVEQQDFLSYIHQLQVHTEQFLY